MRTLSKRPIASKIYRINQRVRDTLLQTRKSNRKRQPSQEKSIRQEKTHHTINKYKLYRIYDTIFLFYLF